MALQDASVLILETGRVEGLEKAAMKEQEPIRNGGVSSVKLVDAIKEAHVRIAGQVVRTPTIRLPWLDTPGREVWAKLDSQQHSGSFKYRGAFNALKKSAFKSIITASAGNHALATAAAGKRLGKEVHVIAPTTASELKINRLMNDASVTLLGQDLFEATKIATNLAQASTKDLDKSLYYLSPYANLDVAAGAGTMMIEAVEDVGEFDSVIVPLGGGGLAAAVASWCSLQSTSTQVICTHPRTFGRSFDSTKPVSKQLHRPISPTYSDGLAVQIIEDTPFAEILDTKIASVVQVTESDTAAAIAYILRLQSLLIEGAAATTIGALIGDSEEMKGCQGRILLLLTGGNVSSSTVARALVADIPNPQLRQKHGLRHVVNAVERHGSVKKHDNGDNVQNSHQTQLSMIEIWKILVLRLKDSTQVLLERFHQKEALGSQLGLHTDSWCTSIFCGMHEQLVNLTAELDGDLQRMGSTHLSLWTVEERYRVLLQLQAALGSLFERASAAYDQSRRDWFFDISAQNSAAVNYGRYGAPELRILEQNFLRILGLGSKVPVELLLTSSGMAAYQVLQQYLLQLLMPGGTVVLPPYIYFEAMEQLQAFEHITIVYSPTFCAEDIIATVEAHNAGAVFIDPVANIVGLPTTDIRHFAHLTASRPGWSDRVIVVDGTMVSGAMSLYDWVQGPLVPTWLYYESASKYLQFGLDIQLGGILVYPTEIDYTMRTIRRNCGAIMYARNAALLPPVDFTLFQTRMSILTTNATLLRNHLQAELSSIAETSFPSEWRKLGWRHSGAVITVRFFREGMNNKEGLEACIDLILRAAEALDVPITKGVSFGFSTTRISAASSMAKDSDPFLRISTGNELAQVEGLGKAMSMGIKGYYMQFEGIQAV